MTFEDTEGKSTLILAYLDLPVVDDDSGFLIAPRYQNSAGKVKWQRHCAKQI